MRVMLSFVAAAGLLIGAFLSGGRLAPPEQGTQSTTSPATILLSVDPAPAGAVAEPAAAAPARGAPASNPTAPVVAPPAAAGADTAEEKSAPAAARDPQPAAAAPAQTAVAARANAAAPASVKPPASDATTVTLPSGSAVRPNVALPTPPDVDKGWRHRMAPTPAPTPGGKPTALATNSPPRDDVRPTPAPPGPGTPALRAQGPTPTPCCGWDPPPLDRTAPGPGQ